MASLNYPPEYSISVVLESFHFKPTPSNIGKITIHPQRLRFIFVIFPSTKFDKDIDEFSNCQTYFSYFTLKYFSHLLTKI